MTTPLNQALWANHITRQCLLEAGSDVEAGLAAAEYILTTQPIPSNLALSTDADDLVSTVRTATRTDSISAFFAHDIANSKAQGILNRALKASKNLSTTAREDLTAALEKSATDSGAAILEFIDEYRLQLTDLLTTTQLASLLEGAREVAANIPAVATFPGAVPPPPSLEPKEAKALVDRLVAMSPDQRAEKIYDLPADQQVYAAQAVAVAEASTPPVPPPGFTPPRSASGAPGSPGGIHFPTIDGAVRELSEKNVVTRQQYDALDAAARQKSLAVAGVDAEDALRKIRDVMAENVEKGADYATFKSQVLDAVDEGTFLSDAHQETVFRTNVQSAFSDGQMAVLQHPLVRSGFPYAAYDSIHDDRVRDDHLSLDTLGIGGTNVYRSDDPVFQMFRPPWDFNCVPCTSLIHTQWGRVPITEVKVGDYVLTHRERFKRVDHVHRTERADELVTVQLESGSFVRATSQHCVLTERGWVEISGLNVSDQVYQVTNPPLPYLVVLKINDGLEAEDLTNGAVTISIGSAGISLNLNPNLKRRKPEVEPEWECLLVEFKLDSLLGKTPGEHLLVRSHTDNSVNVLCWIAPDRLSAGRDHIRTHFGAAGCANSPIDITDLFSALGVESIVNHVRLRSASYRDPSRLKYATYRPISDASVSRKISDANLLLDVVLDSAVHSARVASQACLGVVQIGGRTLWLFPHNYNCNIEPSRVQNVSRQLWNHPVYNLSVDEDESYTCDGVIVHNCRCSWAPITVRQAAEAGIEEAQAWLETGVEPSSPAHVPVPNFAPPPGFQRAITAAPLSIRLSMHPLAYFSTDERGHEHRGKGEGGGQFTGDGGDRSSISRVGPPKEPEAGDSIRSAKKYSRAKMFIAGLSDREATPTKVLHRWATLLGVLEDHPGIAEGEIEEALDPDHKLTVTQLNKIFEEFDALKSAGLAKTSSDLSGKGHSYVVWDLTDDGREVLPAIVKEWTNRQVAEDIDWRPNESLPEDYSAFSITLSTDDTYPRDKSNRFVDKLLIAEAARDPAKAAELRESLPETECPKLDVVVSRLQWGGLIHHPKENPGLAVGIDGAIADPRWVVYAVDRANRDTWEENGADRTNRREAVESFTKGVRSGDTAKVVRMLETLRNPSDDMTVAEVRDLLEDLLDICSSRLDDTDDQLKDVGATDSEIRESARLRHRLESKVGTKVEGYVAQFKKARKDGSSDTEMDRLVDRLDELSREVGVYRAELDDLYEETAEAIHKRIEAECEADPEPPVPEEPSDSQLILPTGGVAFAEWKTIGGHPEGDKKHVDGFRVLIDESGTIRKGRMRGTKVRNVKARFDQLKGKRSGSRSSRPTDVRPGGAATPQQPVKTSGPVAPATTGPGNQPNGKVGQVTGEPSRSEVAGNTRTSESARLADSSSVAELDTVNRRLDRYAKFFESKSPNVAWWIGELKEHINKVGVEAAIDSLEAERSGTPIERAQYGSTGSYDDASGWHQFVSSYLDRTGIQLQFNDTPDPSLRTIASAPVPQDKTANYKPGDVIPTEMTLDDKLQESKLLPGLESTEDINSVVGRKVTNLTPDVLKALDAKYGEGKWIIKSYGDESYAGFGIFFPQRVTQIQQDAKQTIFHVGQEIGDHNFVLARDDQNTVVGVQESTWNRRTFTFLRAGVGPVYKFNSKEYDELQNEEVKRLGRVAASAARSEKGTVLPRTSEEALLQDYRVTINRNENGAITGITTPEGRVVPIIPKISTEGDIIGITGTQAYNEFRRDHSGSSVNALHKVVVHHYDGPADVGFMVQPAFEAVGVTEADRAKGITWERSHEGRVHVTVKNGKASVVPYATLSKRGEFIPVVFANDDTRAMEKAAQDAIDALPQELRTGQVYAPDVMKTKDGWKVVELNASVPTGQSLALEENPLVIDAYVSHITGRDPSHVRFIRQLLKGKMVTPSRPQPGIDDPRVQPVLAMNTPSEIDEPGDTRTVTIGRLKVKYSTHSNKKIEGISLSIDNYRQQDIHSCGFVAALSVSRYYRPDTSAKDVLTAVRPSINWGVDRYNLAAAMKKLGVKATYHNNLTVDNLRNYVDHGIPVIVSVWPDEWISDHWTVVQGFSDDHIHLTNHKSLSIDSFKEQWSDMDMRGHGNSKEGLVCIPDGETEDSFKVTLISLSTDAEGHEHKGKGEGGGQFTSKGSAGESSGTGGGPVQGAKSGGGKKRTSKKPPAPASGQPATASPPISPVAPATPPAKPDPFAHVSDLEWEPLQADTIRKWDQDIILEWLAVLANLEQMGGELPPTAEAFGALVDPDNEYTPGNRLRAIKALHEVLYDLGRDWYVTRSRGGQDDIDVSSESDPKNAPWLLTPAGRASIPVLRAEIERRTEVDWRPEHILPEDYYSATTQKKRDKKEFKIHKRREAREERAREPHKSEAEWRSHPTLVVLGNKLHIKDIDHPGVQKNLRQLSTVPQGLMSLLISKGTPAIYVANATVPGLDDNRHLRGVAPRGWSPGMTWDDVPGCQHPETGVMVGVGHTGSISTMLHEFGHEVGQRLELDESEALKKHHRRLFHKLRSYYTQGGPGSEVGCQEFMAEGFATVMVDRARAVELFDDEFVEWVDEIIRRT